MFLLRSFYFQTKNYLRKYPFWALYALAKGLQE